MEALIYILKLFRRAEMAEAKKHRVSLVGGLLHETLPNIFITFVLFLNSQK